MHATSSLSVHFTLRGKVWRHELTWKWLCLHSYLRIKSTSHVFSLFCHLRCLMRVHIPDLPFWEPPRPRRSDVTVRTPRVIAPSSYWVLQAEREKDTLNNETLNGCNGRIPRGRTSVLHFFRIKGSPTECNFNRSICMYFCTLCTCPGWGESVQEGGGQFPVLSGGLGPCTGSLPPPLSWIEWQKDTQIHSNTTTLVI